LRFGALNAPQQGTFRGAVWENHHYDITIGPRLTALARDGKNRFEANAGVVVRKYEVAPTRLSFTIDTTGRVKVTTTEFDGGALSLYVDGSLVGPIPVTESHAPFEVPAGRHAIELRR
jgi:hypothetical protein